MTTAATTRADPEPRLYTGRDLARALGVTAPTIRAAARTLGLPLLIPTQGKEAFQIDEREALAIGILLRATLTYSVDREPAAFVAGLALRGQIPKVGLWLVKQRHPWTGWSGIDHQPDETDRRMFAAFVDVAAVVEDVKQALDCG